MSSKNRYTKRAKPMWVDVKLDREVRFAREMLAMLRKIVKKSYLRPGKHEDCHVHPDLIDGARTLIKTIKATSKFVPAKLKVRGSE